MLPNCLFLRDFFLYIVKVFYMNENSSLKHSMEILQLALVFISQTKVINNGLHLGKNISLLNTQHFSISLYPPVIVYSLT